MAIREAQLVLADGTVFEGEAIGAEPPDGVAAGEVVFNTVLAGYQEVLTDPSYAGQIITFTATHIGNYGVNLEDFESRGLFCRGVVVRELARRRSNYRSDAELDALLRRYEIPGIGGIDTRRLTRHLRDSGAMPGAFGTADQATLRAAAAAEPGTDGIDLVAQVTTSTTYEVGAPQGQRSGTGDPGERSGRTIVAYDFGIKHSILRGLAGLGTVVVVPASTTAADVLALNPDGVFLSNGPGDPAEVDYAAQAIAGLLGQVPVFGICLGHQLLCRALGGSTYKLPFGHHGGNHPVRHEPSGRIEITSQNHNFCVDPASLDGKATVTHRNLNDGTIEGLRVTGVPAFSVQYHPEAGPGPHDAAVPVHDVRRDDRRPRCLARRAFDRGRGRCPADRLHDARIAGCRAGGGLMPKRTDLHSILIIGSGPIVIGQACEFDYSGTQACRVLKEEGYRVILANSNPATIMTDPDFADATYVEPLTVEILRKIIERERPDAVLPTLGGQTGLNLAMALHAEGLIGVPGTPEMIGANALAIATAEDRDLFKQAMIEIGLNLPISGAAHDIDEARKVAAEIGLPVIIRPAYILGGRGHRHRGDRRGVRTARSERAGGQPDRRDPRRAVDRRLEGVRARGDARPGGQLRDHLLDRERRPDGGAHRRLDHRRSGADPDRRRVPADAGRGAAPASGGWGSRPAARTSSSRSTRRPANRSSSR